MGAAPSSGAQQGAGGPALPSDPRGDRSSPFCRADPAGHGAARGPGPLPVLPSFLPQAFVVCHGLSLR